MEKITYLLKSIFLISLLGIASSCTKWNYQDGGLANGIHDCSMWDYFKKQPYDWDSTMVMIEHAGMRDIFEGKSEYGQITFLGVTNLSIQTYLLQNKMKRVTDMSPAFCKKMLSKLIIPQRLMVANIPRGERIASTGAEVGGIRTQTLDGELFMWTHQEPYMEILDVGEIALYFHMDGAANDLRIYSTDIQTNNGVVQALGYDFIFDNINN